MTIKLTNFAISRRGQILWNTVLDAILRETESLPLFKTKVKEMLLSRDNELKSFNDFQFNVLLLNYVLLFPYVIISDSLYITVRCS